MPSDRGAFITLEGVDGSGKSTQAAMLVFRLRESGFEVVSLREPGGTSISEKIRGLLLDPANAEMSDECELLLYEASRAQLVREVVEPALRGADLGYYALRAFPTGYLGVKLPAHFADAAFGQAYLSAYLRADEYGVRLVSGIEAAFQFAPALYHE